MEWWIWLLAGLLLLLAELVTPGGFYIIFFGIGAIIVGILTGFQAAGPTWFQFILFSIVSVLSLWLFREKLLQLTRARSSDGSTTWWAKPPCCSKTYRRTVSARRKCAAPRGTHVTSVTNLSLAASVVELSASTA